MSKREPDAYYIVPEYRRDPKRSGGAFYATRIRYTIRSTTFPPFHKTGIFKDIESDLTLAQAKRRVKSWRAWKRKKNRKPK